MKFRVKIIWGYLYRANATEVGFVPRVPLIGESVVTKSGMFTVVDVITELNSDTIFIKLDYVRK